MTSTIMKKIVEKHASPQVDLLSLRIACIRSVGFAGLMRYSELANIISIHIRFEQDHVRILILSSKTDIYWEGNCVYIKKIDSEHCPTKILQRYVTTSNAYANPNLHIFRPLRFFRKEGKYQPYGTKLSYT